MKKLAKNTSIILFLFLLCSNLYGNKKDSLLTLINQNIANDTTSLRYYNELIDLTDKFDVSNFLTLNLNREKLSVKIIVDNPLDSTLVFKTRGVLNSTFNNLANTYSDLGDVDKALQYFEESKKILYILKDKKNIAYNLINTGYTYWVNGFLEETKVNIKTALAIGKELKDDVIIERSLSALGSFYVQEGKLDSATYYYEIALVKAKELENIETISVLYNSLGYVATLKDNDSLALSYFEKSLAGFVEIGASQEMTVVLRDLSRLSLKKGNLEEAESWAEKSYKISKDVGFPMSIKFSAQLLSEVYEVQNKGMKALEFYKLSVIMKDSLEQESNVKAIAQQQAKYEYEKQKLVDDVENEMLLTVEMEKKDKQFVYTAFSLVVLSLVVVFLFFIYRRLQVTKKQKGIIETKNNEVEKQKIEIEIAHKETERQKLVVEKQKEKVELINERLEEVNKEISDSIAYAELIQQAVLPTIKIEDLTKESFIYFNPKEKVSGDFYWMEQREEFHGYAVADCTGHGIPGAFISMIGTILLNEIYNAKKIEIPNQILDELSRLVRLTLTNKEGYTMKDGMDISFTVLDSKTKMLYFSGANNPVWIASNNPTKRINKATATPISAIDGKYIYEIKGDKQPIGYYGENVKPFTLNSAHLEEGEIFYLFSDGYADQFGGEKNKKYKAKPFRELLLSLFDMKMEKQHAVLNENFLNWKGSYEQIDDVTVMGVRV